MMQNIHVKRYDDPAAVGGFLGTIEPEDRSFIVFVNADGTPQLWLRVKVEGERPGEVEHSYASAEVLAQIGMSAEDARSQVFGPTTIADALNPPDAK